MAHTITRARLPQRRTNIGWTTLGWTTLGWPIRGWPILASCVAIAGCGDGSTAAATTAPSATDTPSATETTSNSAPTSSDGFGGAQGAPASGGSPAGTSPVQGTIPTPETTSNGGAMNPPSGAAGETSGGGSSGTQSGPGGAGSGGTPSSSDDGGASGSATTGGTGNPGGENGEGGEGGVDIVEDALFVSPEGTAGAQGTIEDPTTLADAVSRVLAGETIYLRGGTYVLSDSVELGGDGNDGAPIELRVYPLDSERPLLDFSSMAESSDNRGLVLSGNHWHVYGLDVFSAGDNCMFVGGSDNTIEYSTFSECADTGLQLGNGASNNLVLNCDSFFNADSSLENADGFAAKLDVGTGNRFVGCRAWNNLDDGWDGYLRPADNVTTTHENCWAIDNGKLQDGSVGAGDGNGFKTGGSDGKDLSHNATYTRCIATGNVNDGFDHNSNRGNVTILNSAAHGNGANINFGSTNIAASLTIKNTLSLGSNGDLSATTTDISNNSWQDDLSVTEDDFISVDTAPLKASRKSDGSLPDVDYLVPLPGSSLQNAGTDVGLPYSGSAPDIGPFESDE